MVIVSSDSHIYVNLNFYGTEFFNKGFWWLMTIQQNLTEIKNKIKLSIEEAGSCAGRGQLIAVSKTRSVEEISQALETGHRLFGENRVQEAATKWPDLKLQFPDIDLHLIGPLQSNKAAEAVALFDVIETIDRPKIALAIAKEMKTQKKELKLFVQVNVGEEPQKAGIAPAELEAFLKLCREEYDLTISGLMCIPPVDEEPSPYFVLLKHLARDNNVSHVSMGMSSDFETALQLGADYIRVGTAIFGQRIT